MNILTQAPPIAGTPEPAPGHDILFRPTVGRHLPDLHDIADAARVDFESGADYEAPLPTATPEELRAHLRELAPVVHSQLWQVQMLETNYEIPGVAERNGPRAQTPPLFAHFALTALALIEAEADDEEQNAKEREKNALLLSQNHQFAPGDFDDSDPFAGENKPFDPRSLEDNERVEA